MELQQLTSTHCRRVGHTVTVLPTSAVTHPLAVSVELVALIYGEITEVSSAWANARQ
jgi:hypothetical protein